MKMKPGIFIALAVVLSLPLCLSALAGSDNARAREAGPEDGILCCNGATPFLFDRDEVLTTTGRAGIFRSENRGNLWQRSMSGLVAPNGVSPFVDDLCQAPSEPSIVYALAGLGAAVTPFNGLFSSEDLGKTWTRRASVSTGFGLAHCAVDAGDPRTVYIANTDANFVGQLWKSTDGGQTVNLIGANLPSFFGNAFMWTVRGTLYIFPDQVYASTDGGASFQLVPVPQGAQIYNFDASPDGRAIFFETFDASFHPTGTFRSTDNGASFVSVSGLLPPIGSKLLAFDPTDPSRIYATDGLLHVSSDGGLTFALLPASNDPRFLGPDPVREIGVDGHGSVYLDTLAGPFRTDDGGQTFRAVLNGFRASSVQDLAFDADGNLLAGVTHTQVVFRQTYGLDFQPVGNTPLIRINGFDNDAAAVAASPTDANVILVATGEGQGVYRTDDGGRSWSSATVVGSPAGYVNARMAFPTSSRVYLASPAPPAFQPGLYRSNDAGRTFALLSNLPFGAIGVDPTNPDILYVGAYNSPAGLFKSTNGGQTLENLGQPGAFSAIAVDRSEPQVIYAGRRSGQVIRSVDSGQTFAPASNGLAGAGVLGLAQDSSGRLFVWLRGGGLFSSDDGASSWQPVDTGEALRRSGLEAGRGSLVADPRRPGRIFLGNAGVIEIRVRDDRDNE